MTQLLIAPEFCEHHAPTHAAQMLQVATDPTPSWKAVVVYKCRYCCTHEEVTDSQQIRIMAGGEAVAHLQEIGKTRAGT